MRLGRFFSGTKVTLWATGSIVATYRGPPAIYGGYWCGGGSSIDVIDKIRFDSDTRATLDATLSGNSDSAAGLANSRVAGYVGGGNEANSTDRIDKISFPNDGRTTLTATLQTARWAPAGFARGFCALSDIVEIQYKCTGTYNSKCESGILWNDSKIGIKWPIKNPRLSEKDKNAQILDKWLEKEESNNF